MGIFDLFKKKEQPKENKEGKILLAMPMFLGSERYELNSIVTSLKDFWGLNVTSIEGNNDSAILKISGESIAIAFMPMPIPNGDIEGTAQYAYNWTTVLEDIKDFSGHAIVSLLSGTQPTIDRFKLLSKVLYSILKTSNSIGIYQGNQSLLIPKGQYIESAEEMKNGATPIDIWIYIGIRTSQEGNSIYTYGLKEFSKLEMEIINSKLPLEELYNFMSNICAYLIGSNVTFKNGETFGYTADQKVKISLSKGKFVDGETFKLEM